MLESILDYEEGLFLFLNSLQSPMGNQFMWLFSSKIAWVPVAVFFIVVLCYKNWHRKKELLLLFVAIALVITLCDQFASTICKPFFARLRPTHHPDFMENVKTVFDYSGGRYGFISSHAANAFGFAALTSQIFKYKFYLVAIYTWAVINSYSRIYLGVHFISDIVAGILAGLFFGWIVYKMYVFIHRKFICNEVSAIDVNNNNSCQYEGLNYIVYMLILTVVVMAVLSLLYALRLIPALI